MKTIKIIDLLNKIANGEEVPKQIKCRDKIWVYDKINQDYTNNVDGNDLLCYLFGNIRTNDFINDEVEIIKDKLEKIDKIETTTTYCGFDSEEENIKKAFNLIHRNEDKINELIAILNYLLEKSDKDE